MTIRKYSREDTKAAMEIWNSIVEDGVAFPQMECLTEESAVRFFEGQSHTGIAIDDGSGEIVGLYILHPNNVGRCGHICNTSYAVKEGKRGLHIGEQLVKDSLNQGRYLVAALSGPLSYSFTSLNIACKITIFPAHFDLY